MNNIAIIPARGGSKRIPKKNIKDFLGKPIIAYSIEAALKSQIFSDVIVSTDSEEIASIAKSYGVQVPFIRPKNLADDFTGTTPVTAHAILEYEKIFSKKVHYACCIYATAPFIQINYLKKGNSAIRKKHIDFAFSASNYSYPIEKAFHKTKLGTCKMLFPEKELIRSQDLKETYHDAGQFYFGKRKSFIKNLAIFSPSSIPILIPNHLVQDIDTYDDWYKAELMLTCLNKKEKNTKY